MPARFDRRTAFAARRKFKRGLGQTPQRGKRNFIFGNAESFADFAIELARLNPLETAKLAVGRKQGAQRVPSRFDERFVDDALAFPFGIARLPVRLYAAARVKLERPARRARADGRVFRQNLLKE